MLKAVVNFARFFSFGILMKNPFFIASDDYHTEKITFSLVDQEEKDESLNVDRCLFLNSYGVHFPSLGIFTFFQRKTTSYSLPSNFSLSSN